MKAPVTATTTATSTGQLKKSNRIPTKHEQCLYALLRAGSEGINQLRALSLYGDTCVNTTISELGNKRGLLISRDRRPHQHQLGGATSFTWYWFADRIEAKRALRTLNTLRRARGCLPLPNGEAYYLLSQFPERKGAA